MPRLAAALVGQPAEVVHHPRRRAAPALQHLGLDRERDGVEGARHVARPRLDLVGLVDGDAEQLRDHRHRQGIGEVLDHVHAPRLGHPVEQAVHDRLDARPERLDDARREGLADEGAEPRVVRRVAEEHRQREPRRVGPAAEARLEEGLVSALPEARVAEERGDVVVAREDEEPEGMPVDRRFGAEPMVDGIRIGEEAGIEEVELAHARPIPPLATRV